MGYPIRYKQTGYDRGMEPAASGEWCRANDVFDKIEGLEADLESAVEVAFKRGATDWVRLNYPAQYERMNGHE